jgi:hypothetical protein
MSELPFFNRRVLGLLTSPIVKAFEVIANSRALKNKSDRNLADYAASMSADTKWLRSPDNAMPTTTTANQEEKRAFFEAGMGTCVRCQSSNLEYFSYDRNARSDGDGYGVDRIACPCGFVVDFAYDESGGPHYFETERWDATQYRQGGSKL